MIFKYLKQNKYWVLRLAFLLVFGTCQINAQADAKIWLDKKEYKVLYKKGMDEMYNGNYEKGYKILRKALDLGRSDWSEKPYDYSEASYELAFGHFRKKEFEQAILLYQESIMVWEVAKGKNESDKVFYSQGLADCYLAIGKFAKAELLLAYSKAYYQKHLPDQATDYLEAGESLAKVYLKLGNFENAKLEYNSLVNSAVANMDRSRILQAQAQLHLQLNEYDEAEKLFLTILEELKGQWISDNYFHASAYLDMANFYVSQGKYDLAEKYTLKAIDVHKEGFSKESIEHAAALLQLAIVYKYQERIEEEEMLIMALKMAEEAVGDKDRAYSVFCIFLAEFYASKFRYDQSVNYYLKSENCLRLVVGVNHPEYAVALQNLALVKEKTGDVDAATHYFTQAMRIWLDQMDENLSGLSESELTKFYQSFTVNFELFQSFVLRNYQIRPELLATMLNLRLATKGFLFQNTQKIEAIVFEKQDKHLNSVYAEWKDLKKKISSIYNMPLEERMSRKLELQTSIDLANELEKELSIKVNQFQKDSSEVNWQLVKARLKSNEAAIELIRLNYYGDQPSDSIVYLGLVYKRDSQLPSLVVWQNGRDLEGKYHTKLKNSIQYKIKDSHSYTTYWQPLMDELSSIEKAYLSSDGVFHTISFNALWNSQTSKYLYEEIDIELLNNTKDLLGVSSSDHESKGAVLIGFPTYETQKTGGKKSRNKQLSKELLSDTTSRFMRSDGKITPLPGTKREIQKIDSLLRGDLEEVDLLTDIYATEQAVKHIKSPRILHIATHGFFLKDEHLQSSKSSFGLASEIYFQNPLMRSGLLLANAESALNQGGDGILTAYEVQNLNLEKTEIVVLSACETGIGDIRNGEGVYGLHRALQAAGASATLMSLWKVSDVATQKLMTHFYQFWIKENLSKQQAFKQAQIALRAEYPAPYYWASFVMIGY